MVSFDFLQVIQSCVLPNFRNNWDNIDLIWVLI